MVRARSLIPAALAAALFATLPSTARAVPKAKDFDQGGYIYGAPGLFVVPFNSAGSLTWGYGIGGGYLWTFKSPLKIAFGGVFEHFIYNHGFDHVHPGMIRILPEVRVGGGKRRWWAYGKLAPGVAISLWDHGGNDADAGFNTKIGGGGQFMVYKGLMLGVEADVDIAILVDADDNNNNNNDVYDAGAFWFKFILGWYFG